MSKTFVEVNLGTDTSLNKAFIEEEYLRGESLCFSASLVNPINPQPCFAPLHINAENIAVIDGPTTFGFEVFDRINLGVNVLLKAIANGKNNLILIGHSRGACQSILIAHEMDRFKKIFLDEATTDLTPELIQKLSRTIGEGVYFTPDGDLLTPDNFKKLKTNFSDVNIKMFLLDPVPGGGILGVRFLKWHHNLFYSLPDIVVDYEQYIYENERTRCFKAIVPKFNHSMFKIISIPGHHGTGSGNLYDQGKFFRDNRGWLPQNVAGVQNLIVAEIVYLLRSNGLEFRKRDDAHPHTEELKNIAYRVLESSEAYEAEVIQQKQDILDKLAFYQEFNKTCYPYLTQEQSLVGWFVNKSSSRTVHWGSSDDHQLVDKMPSKRSIKFLDMYHLQLYLKKLEAEHFDLEDPITCLTKLNEFPEQDWITQAHLVDDIFSHLCQSYVADQYNLDDGQQQQLAELIKAILDRELPRQNLSASQANLIDSPKARINQVFKLKAQDLSDKIQSAFESLNLKTKLQEDLHKLESLRVLPQPFLDCIENLKSQGILEVSKLEACRSLQEEYSFVFEILESWTPKSIEQKQITIFRNLCRYYNQYLSMKKHSQLLSTEDFKCINQDTEIMLNHLVQVLSENLRSQLALSNWSLIKLIRLLDQDDFQHLLVMLNDLKPIQPGELQEINQEIQDLKNIISSRLVPRENINPIEELEKKFGDFKKIKACFTSLDKYDISSIQQLNSDIETQLRVYDGWQQGLIELTEHYQANLNMRDESGDKLQIINKLMKEFQKTRPSYFNIHYFYEELERSQAQLVCHRDEGWKRFMMSAFNLIIWGGVIAGVVALSLTGHLIMAAVIGALTLITLSIFTYDRYQTYGRFNIFGSNGEVYVEALNQMKVSMTV